MFKTFANVTASKDLSPEIKRMLDDLAKTQVLVGIPEGGGDRSGDITNAQLLFVHTHGVREQEMREEMNPKIESGEQTYSQAYELFIQSNGSPLWHSPPRPVLEPAIEKNKEVIGKQLQKVASTVLEGQDPEQELQKAGMLGQNIARAWFTDPANGWAPNADSTVEMKGSDRPLIDKGEMRKAITYVVDKGNGS